MPPIFNGYNYQSLGSKDGNLSRCHEYMGGNDTLKLHLPKEI